MSRLERTRRTGSILALVLSLLSLVTDLRTLGQISSASPKHSILPARTPYENPWLTPGSPTGESQWVVRAFYSDGQMVNEVAAWREPWEVHHDRGYLVLDVNRAEYERLEAGGFRLEIDWQLTAQLTQANVRLPGQITGIPGYPCYRTVEETFAVAQAIVTEHPELATWIDIGDSWEKTQEGGTPGYDLMVLRLTNSTTPGPKPKLFSMSSLHAREYAPAELNSRFAQYLVENYDTDPDVTWLLDHHEIHLLLQANPDGRKQAETGLSWRKNTNNDYCSFVPNWRGADLNRNFEFQWGCCGGSSGNECIETYRGPSPASEPETQAIQDYVRAQFPDQREDEISAAAPITATGLFLDIHSYSELVIWPWGYTTSETANGAALQTLGRKFAFFNSYEPEQAVYLYTTDGTTDDFAYGELGLAAYTFELGTSYFQDCSTFEATILPDNLAALMYAALVSRTPYITPSGPDALDVVISPEVVALGELVRLTATIDDTRYYQHNGVEPTQDIAAAEFYIDVPPWVTTATPLPVAMSATDGAFDETQEAVEATIDSSGLNEGRHIVFVRGQDTEGNWGAFGAVFVQIAPQGFGPVEIVDVVSNSPVILGELAHLAANTSGRVPITYTWDFGDDTIVLSGPGLSSVTHTYGLSDTYTVTLEVSNAHPSNDRATLPVQVIAVPWKHYLPTINKGD